MPPVTTALIVANVAVFLLQSVAPGILVPFALWPLATGDLGIGASFAVRENFMVGVEALRHEFENLPDSAEGAPVDDQEQDTTINTITLRGSFRF